MKHALTFTNIYDSDISKTGRAGYDLAKSSKVTRSIPLSFVISTSVFEEFAGGMPSTREEAEEKISLSSIPGDVREELLEAYKSLAGSDRNLLSSDEPVANLYLSTSHRAEKINYNRFLLNIKGEEGFFNAVKTLWLRSYYEDEAEKAKVQGEELKPAIIVQEAIPFDSTVEVHIDKHNINLKAYKGLPDVTKKVAKDSVKVNYEELSIENYDVASQEYKVVLGDNSGSLVKLYLKDKSSNYKIEREEAIEAGRISKKLYKYFSKPLNILLGLRNGKLYILYVEEDYTPSFSEIEDSWSEEGQGRSELKLAGVQSQVQNDSSNFQEENPDHFSDGAEEDYEDSEHDDSYKEDVFGYNNEDSDLELGEEKAGVKEKSNAEFDGGSEGTGDKVFVEVERGNEDDESAVKEDLVGYQDEQVEEFEVSIDMAEEPVSGVDNSATDSVQSQEEVLNEKSDVEFGVEYDVESGGEYDVGSNVESSEKSGGESVNSSEFLLDEVKEEDGEDEFLSVNESKDSKTQRSEDIVVELEEKLDDKVYGMYKDSFGLEPASFESALVDLDMKYGLDGVEDVLDFKQLKEKVDQGLVSEGNLKEYEEKIKKFLGDN